MLVRMDRLRIAPQGRYAVLAAVLITVIVSLLVTWYWTVPLWLALAGLLYIFRDPGRTTPALPLGVVSPADGRVISVSTAHDPYIQRQALLIRVQMTYLGSYIIRSPIEGKVTDQWYEVAPAAQRDGAVDGAAHAEGQARRCRAIWIKTDEGDDVTLVIHRRCPFCQPQFYSATGERVGHGHRCGFLFGGGMIDLFVPDNTRLDCSAGDRVLAGSDIMATLVHK